MATSMEENGRNVTYIAVGGRSHERLFTSVDVWLNFHPWKFPCKKFAENFVAVSLEVEKTSMEVNSESIVWRTVHQRTQVVEYSLGTIILTVDANC